MEFKLNIYIYLKFNWIKNSNAVNGIQIHWIPIQFSRDYGVEIFQFKTNSKPKPILVGQDD
jgi:hypothetical protein